MIQSIQTMQSIPQNTSSTQDTLSPLISLVTLQPYLKTYNTAVLLQHLHQPLEQLAP